MRKKIIISLIILGLVGASVVLFPKIAARKKGEVATAKVERKSLQQTVAASGKIRSEKEVELKFQTSGQLAWVKVEEGDFVKQWQAIAGLDQKELQKTLEKYLKDYAKERWDFAQDRETYHVSTDNLDRYILANDARRLLEKNQFDLDKAVLDVELKDLALKYATLLTPIGGIVTRVDTPVAGVNITPATAVFTVADPNEMIFEANVDEIDIGLVREGQKAILTLDAYPEEETEVQVEQISFTATTTRGGGTAFPVKFSLPKNQDLKFKLGMNGDTEIIIQKKEGVLVVPSEAIIQKNGKFYLWVIKEGLAHKQEVKIGLETDLETEILEGVSVQDKVITEGTSGIKEGERVR
jgi:RND family efflux transporter MFP subunit